MMEAVVVVVHGAGTLLVVPGGCDVWKCVGWI